ncbi:pyruvate kinase [Spirulina subsalsa FACHB-351]|uniref:Pyruvate kinase n=1 Tax=Spirulina subsalsa FACHB-351 TaxID=234711 RepID=A0ABT3L6A0_9CYAN|nr:pyruvate kinase [Spirulina subsalsa]MCW6037024.1 pyruvate kinase [Spirulina subsalsa FACHB-351]
MSSLPNRTKVVATLGPASNSPEVIRELVAAGMRVARFNFSHGSYRDHATTLRVLRAVSEELDTPVTILQDLQGPKIRVGQLPTGSLELVEGTRVKLVPVADYDHEGDQIPLDYAYLAEEAQPGTEVLLADGLLELCVEEIDGPGVICRVVEGGRLQSRKGVNFPSLNLRLPSMTEKDKKDLEFGISQGIDWVSLSFVRRAEDIRSLKAFLSHKGAGDICVIAKIEKPQAIAHLEEILSECNGLMVARGDLGVELSPEKVPMLQKRIIRMCNQRGIPVITATQMLESMIVEPRPTRAEASDVANAIIDGTDAIMLSGESAVGKYPVKAVETMVQIATQVEPEVQFVNYPPYSNDETHALSEALNTIDKILELRCIVAFTTSGYTACLAAAERPKAIVVAFTANIRTYHRLNLIWGVIPVLMDRRIETYDGLIEQAQSGLKERGLAQAGDKILILAGLPLQKTSEGTNFMKIHTVV